MSFLLFIYYDSFYFCGAEQSDALFNCEGSNRVKKEGVPYVLFSHANFNFSHLFPINKLYCSL